MGINWKNMLIYWAVIISIFVACCFISSKAYAYAFTDENAVLAIIGEAENQGYKGLYAVACALRNRGTLKGVYGLRSPRVKQLLFSQVIYNQASKAWMNSLHGKDVTKSATHWHNLEREGENYWTRAMMVTYKIGDHVFYKEMR